MKNQLDRPGYLGLIRTALIILPICFVAYLALVYLPSRRPPAITPEITSTLKPTETVVPTGTPLPTETLVPTIVYSPTVVSGEIEVVQWIIKEVCSSSIRTGVQITGAVITGGNPPYWVESSYVYPVQGDDPLPRKKAVFSGTSNTYTLVSIDPPLNIAANRWVNVTVSTFIAGEAGDWSDRLYFPVQTCYEK